jgi:formylmethanofuran dehydrogenase subunit E
MFGIHHPNHPDFERNLIQVTRCDECGEPIYEGEEYYDDIEGYDICVDCISEWINRYRREA